jgi:hypothetical protein
MKTTSAKSMDVWMSVEIRPGLFPSERTVQFRSADGQEIAVFVSSRQLDEGQQALKVTLLDENKDFALIQVPSQSLIQVPSQSGPTVAKVARRELRPT